MSTSSPGPIVLVALLAAIVGWSRNEFRLQPATAQAIVRRGRHAERASIPLPQLLMAAAGAGGLRRLAHEALGSLPPYPAEYSRPKPSLFRRVRSGVLLLVLIVGLGVACAMSVGIVIFLAGFLLEQAIA